MILALEEGEGEIPALYVYRTQMLRRSESRFPCSADLFAGHE